MALIAGLRKYTVGIDTSQFYNAFTAIGQSSDWTFSEFRYEYGFSLLCKILYLIFKEPQSLILVSSLFINFSVCMFIKTNSKNYFLSTLFYVFLNFYFNYMNIMRQGICIAIMLLFYRFLRERKYVLYLIGLVFASLFHLTAIAGLLLLIAKIFDNDKSFIFLILFVGIISFAFYKQIFTLIASLLGEYYLNYINSVFAESNYFGSLLIFLEYLLLFASCGYLYYKTKNENRSENSKFLFLIGIITLCFSALVMRMNIFNRVMSIFEIYFIIIVPNLITDFKYSKGKVVFKYSQLYSNVKLFTICLSLLFFISINVLRPEWYGVVPYEFFFST